MEEIFSKIGFNWQLAVANLVNFLIIFWLLKRYAFGPIGRAIKNRQGKIEQGLEDAQKAKSELMMAEQNYETKLTEARHQAQEIVSKAHDQAKAMVAKSESETAIKAQKIIDEAQIMAEKEKSQADTKVRTRAVEAAIELSAKIIKEKMDPTKEQDLIRDLLKN